MSDREAKRTERIEKEQERKDPGSSIISAQDRYGYLAAQLLGMDIPPELERKMGAWKAMQAPKKRGRYRGEIPQAARDRLLSSSSAVSEEQAEKDRELLRRAAEAAIARYS